MNSNVNRKYIVILSAVAVVVLVGGAVLRPRKAVPQMPSPSETASLQARVRRDELGETASYFSQRAEALAESVYYDQEHDASVVGWETPGQVLTTEPGAESTESPLALQPRKNSVPVITRKNLDEDGRWLLIVGRTKEGRAIWSPAVHGGVRQAVCAGEVYRELVVNARLDSALAGAAVFDLDGALMAVVARCDGGFHLISAESISHLLRAFESQRNRGGAPFGFRVSELNDAARTLLSVESGLMVTEVTQDDAADLAGISPADVILRADGEPVDSEAALSRALSAMGKKDSKLEIRRGARKILVRLPSVDDAASARNSAFGMHVLPPAPDGGSLVVAPRTPAYQAGLRTGDQLIRIGGERGVSGADFSKAVSSAGDKPLLVVYQRNRLRRAVLISR